MGSSPAVLLLHWWAPLHFKSSFWDVAEDELDTIGSYYDLQVTRGFPWPSTCACGSLTKLASSAALMLLPQS